MYTMITRHDCKYCDKSKKMLDQEGIPYVVYNIENRASKWVLTLMKAAGIKTVPQTFSTDGNLVGGFRELETLMGTLSEKEY